MQKNLIFSRDTFSFSFSLQRERGCSQIRAWLLPCSGAAHRLGNILRTPCPWSVEGGRSLKTHGHPKTAHSPSACSSHWPCALLALHVYCCSSSQKKLCPSRCTLTLEVHPVPRGAPRRDRSFLRLRSGLQLCTCKGQSRNESSNGARGHAKHREPAGAAASSRTCPACTVLLRAY